MATTENFDLIIRARDEASAVMRGIGSSVAGMVAAFVSVGAAVAFLKTSIAEAAEAERVWHDLSASVERHGQAWKNVQNAFELFSKSLQQNSVFDDEAIARSLQVFTDFGARASQAMEYVQAAVDLAVARHMDLEAATQLLAKASKGATEQLKRFGIVLDLESIPPAERMAAVMAEVNKMFGGAAVAQMDTYAGAVARLSNDWKDFQESVGRPSIGVLSQLVGGTSDLARVLGSDAVSAMEKFKIISWGLFPGLSSIVAKEIPGIISALDALDKKALSAAQGLTNFWAMLAPAQPKADREAIDAETAALVEKTKRLKIVLQLEQERGRNLHPVWGGVDVPKIESTIGTDMLKERQEVLKQEVSLVQQVQERYGEFGNAIVSGSQRAADGLVAAFMGAHVRFSEILRQMLAEFLSIFVQRIILSIVTGGTGGGGGLLGILGLGKPGVGGGILGSSAPRLSPQMPGGMGRTVVVNIQGDIIGDEYFVRKRMIPQIERAAELNATRLQIR
jgi:hypothetical protein